MILREMERRHTAADRVTSTLQRHLERAQVTRQSLLREAFAGNLVQQDLNDEPASVVLERIRAARKAEAKKPKAKRMPKAKSKAATQPLLDVIIDHFGNKPFTFEVLRKHVRSVEYDTLRNQLYALLRPVAPERAPTLQMSFDANREEMEFKLHRP